MKTRKKNKRPVPMETHSELGHLVSIMSISDTHHSHRHFSSSLVLYHSPLVKIYNVVKRAVWQLRRTRGDFC